MLTSSVLSEEHGQDVQRHGNDGKGIGAFPALAGRSSDYIVEALTQYKNGETRGAMSGVMWGQSSVLSDADIQTLGDFVEAELK